MTTNLFDKAICFSDIHFGLKHNSKEHNEDCIEFIEWMILEAKKRDAETCIFLGDWHHHRSNINLLTLNYTMEALRKLNASFKKVYIMVGNHDLFYRENREIHSMVIGSEFSNIILVDEPFTSNNVSMIPWLVENEWEKISKINAKYLFGHLELPGFKMNAMVDMPDTGELNSSHLTNLEYVFSGHFHKRQTKGNITYIGNPFGHNYSDVWDFERGAMFLEWDKEPEFINYLNGPKYIYIGLSALLENPDLYLKPKTYLQATLDVDISYEEATFLKETFLTQYNVREFRIIKNQIEASATQALGDIKFKTVDQIVVEQLTNVDSDAFDNKRLIEIYNGL